MQVATLVSNNGFNGVLTRLQLVNSDRIDPLPGKAPQTEAPVAADEADETVQPWERMFPVEEWS